MACLEKTVVVFGMIASSTVDMTGRNIDRAATGTVKD